MQELRIETSSLPTQAPNVAGSGISRSVPKLSRPRRTDQRRSRKKLRSNSAASASADPGVPPHLVIQARMIQNFGDRARSAGLGIRGRVDQPVDAGVNHGAGAHGAGLQRDIEGNAVEAVVAQHGGGGAHGDDLGVSCRVLVAQHTIWPPAMMSPL